MGIQNKSELKKHLKYLDFQMVSDRKKKSASFKANPLIKSHSKLRQKIWWVTSTRAIYPFKFLLTIFSFFMASWRILVAKYSEKQAVWELSHCYFQCKALKSDWQSHILSSSSSPSSFASLLKLWAMLMFHVPQVLEMRYHTLHMDWCSPEDRS